jgi:hypothetical protein
MVTVTAEGKAIGVRRQGFSAIHPTFFGTIVTQLNRNESLSCTVDVQLLPKSIKSTGVTPETLIYFLDRCLCAEAIQIFSTGREVLC